MGGYPVGWTIEEFGKRCHNLLKAEPGTTGRAKIRDLLKEVLMDDTFIARHFGPDNKDPRKCLYEDPELKFCIFAHVHTGAKDSPPHDHGTSWAIYGQADGTTVMNEWDVVARPKDGRPGPRSSKRAATNAFGGAPGFLRRRGDRDAGTRRPDGPEPLYDDSPGGAEGRPPHVRALGPPNQAAVGNYPGRRRTP
jgi:hypothetical protein